MARASYVTSARAMALCASLLAWFCAAQWPDFTPPLPTKPDLAILCVATADHAAYTELLAPYGTHIHVEKPFAASATAPRRMIAAMKTTGKLMAINWPLAWVPAHLIPTAFWSDSFGIPKPREVWINAT